VNYLILHYDFYPETGGVMSVERAVASVVGAVSGWEGISVNPHRFGGQEFTLGKVEVGHIHRNGMVDIPLPRRIRDQVVAEGKAGPHHLLPETGWVTVFARTDAEAEQTLWLLRLSYLQKRLRRSRRDAATRKALLEELDGLSLSQALRRVVE
jgi:hypothetical protein